jgi:sensor histidine kinase regulating citrate/malate metabolism
MAPPGSAPSALKIQPAQVHWRVDDALATDLPASLHKFEQQGLGLFSVRKLPARGGAELQIESRPRDGTSANLELPVSKG